MVTLSLLLPSKSASGSLFSPVAIDAIHLPENDPQIA
jgi:hypothetical protein